MTVTIAFDVYGTLINTHGVLSILDEWLGDDAKAFSKTWRDKQLEYTFRRALMQNYQSFVVCTHDALEYACQFHKVTFSQAQKEVLMDKYEILPAFDDVEPALDTLKNTDTKLYAFSNGGKQVVENLLAHAGILHCFDDIVSCENLKSYKPNPAVYSHFLRESNSSHHQTWLVSSNPFDVIGALSSGWKGAWVQRSEEALFDPWELQPTMVIRRLNELIKVIEK